MHGKESVIAPEAGEILGMGATLPCINTDKLGTFAGDIPRLNDVRETMKLKCLLALEDTKAEFAVASEGSFGPHPQLLIVPANEEQMMFMDRDQRIVVCERIFTLETNFAGRWIQEEHELYAFAHSIGFPAHGIMLRPSPDSFVPMYKGITDHETLYHCFRSVLDSSGTVYAETDMRAMHNPTRMKQIGLLARKLFTRVACFCPACQFPGFGLTAIREGLPCRRCGIPTRTPRYHLKQCASCSYKEELEYPDGRTDEDPAYCDWCNP